MLSDPYPAVLLPCLHITFRGRKACQSPRHHLLTVKKKISASYGSLLELKTASQVISLGRIALPLSYSKTHYSWHKKPCCYETILLFAEYIFVILHRYHVLRKRPIGLAREVDHLLNMSEVKIRLLYHLA
jgi:hypothetical protein